MGNDRAWHRGRDLTRHRRIRKIVEPVVASGQATCARCGEVIEPGTPWDLGHLEGGNRNAIAGPEHQACNRRAGARFQRRRVSVWM